MLQDQVSRSNLFLRFRRVFFKLSHELICWDNNDDSWKSRQISCVTVAYVILPTFLPFRNEKFRSGDFHSAKHDLRLATTSLRWPTHTRSRVSSLTLRSFCFSNEHKK